MEMIELSQKEIRALLCLMDSIDLETIKCDLTITELVQLHSKINAARTF